MSDLSLTLDADMPEAARATVRRLVAGFPAVTIQRLPPMGALHWIVIRHHAGGAESFRVGAHGSLMAWPVKP